MENKKEIILDWKDYTPPVLNDDPEFAEVVLEDINGTKFKAKFRKPNTAELIKTRREGTRIVNRAEAGDYLVEAKEVIFDIIAKNFDMLPKGLTSEMLTEDSIDNIVNTFFRKL